MRHLRWLPLFACLVMFGCTGFEFPSPTPLPTPGGPGNNVFATQDVTLAAGMTELQPATSDTLTPTINLTRLGVSSLQRVYELETPVGEDFAFSVVARGAGNAGFTQISVAHAAANGTIPATGVESLAANGLALEGSGMNYRGTWIDATGDGFSRITFRGNIANAQVIVIAVPRITDVVNIGVRVNIGNQSPINVIDPGISGMPPGMTNTTIFSSDSWAFGLPAIAVSGDRYSVATYDGDASQRYYTSARKRQWLQYNAQTSVVTGGNADCPSSDSGFWRDQEIAAEGNVLAVVYTGNGEVRADISLDRGANFGIQQVLNTGSCWGQHLVQAALASDYTLGCLFWRTVGSSSLRSELVLVEGTPTGFDATNTPIGYAFGTPRVVHDALTDVTPLLMHMVYSSGGDLVIGYGYTVITPGPNWTVTSSSRFRCAMRQYGQTNFLDTELDREDFTMPSDPHVCVLGSGPSMQIFYAYEKTDGIHLLHSANAGLTFTAAAYAPEPGAGVPSVHARMQGAQTRVDLLYVAQASMGLEIHNVHWDDFSTSTPQLYRVTQATAVAGGTPPSPGMPQGYDITSVDWFGYDAVIKGDDVAIAVVERRYNSYEIYWMNWGAPGGGVVVGASGGSGGGYTPPPAPVLLPGMTGSVPAPNAAHRNQLKLITLD